MDNYYCPRNEGKEIGHCWHYYVGLNEEKSTIVSRKWCCWCGEDLVCTGEHHGKATPRYNIMG